MAGPASGRSPPLPRLRLAPLPSAGRRDEYTDSARAFKKRHNESLTDHPEGKFPDLSPKTFMGRYNASLDEHQQYEPVTAPPVQIQPAIVPAVSGPGIGWERGSTNRVFNERYNASVPEEIVPADESTGARLTSSFLPSSRVGWERASEQQISSEFEMPTSETMPRTGSGWERPEFNRYFKTRYNHTEPEPEPPIRKPVQPQASRLVPPVRIDVTRAGSGWERAPDRVFSGRYNDSSPPEEIQRTLTSVYDADKKPAILIMPDLPRPPWPQQEVRVLSEPERPRYFGHRYNVTIDDHEEAAPLTFPGYPGIGQFATHKEEPASLTTGESGMRYEGPAPPFVPPINAIVSAAQPSQERVSSGWERQHSNVMFDSRYNETTPEDHVETLPQSPSVQPAVYPAIEEQRMPSYAAHQGIKWESPDNFRSFENRYNVTSEHEEAPMRTGVVVSTPPKSEEISPLRGGQNEWGRLNKVFDSRYNVSVTEDQPAPVPYSTSSPVVLEVTQPPPMYVRHQGIKWEGPDSRGFGKRYNETFDYDEAPVTTVAPPLPPKRMETERSYRLGGGWERQPDAAFDSRYNISVTDDGLEMAPSTMPATATPKITHPPMYVQHQGIKWERPDNSRVFQSRYNATIPVHHEEGTARTDQTVGARKATSERVIDSEWQKTRVFDVRYNETHPLDEQHPEKPEPVQQKVNAVFGPVRYDHMLHETDHHEIVPNDLAMSRVNKTDQVVVVPPPEQTVPDMTQLPVASEPTPQAPVIPLLGTQRRGSLWERPDGVRPFKDRFNLTKPAKYRSPGIILPLYDRTRPVVPTLWSVGSRFNSSVDPMLPASPIRRIINTDADAEVPDWQRKLVFINASLPYGSGRPHQIPQPLAPLIMQPQTNASREKPCVNATTNSKGPKKYVEGVVGRNPNSYTINRDAKLEELFDESLEEVILSMVTRVTEPSRLPFPPPSPSDAMVPVQQGNVHPTNYAPNLPAIINHSIVAPPRPFDLPPTMAPETYSTNAMQLYYLPTKLHVPYPTEIQQQNSSRLIQERLQFSSGTVNQGVPQYATTKTPKRPTKGFKTGVKHVPPFRRGQVNISAMDPNKPRKKFATNSSLVRPVPGRARQPAKANSISYDPNNALATRKRSKGFKVTRRPTTLDTLGFTMPPYSPPPVIDTRPVIHMPNTSWNMQYGNYNIAVPAVQYAPNIGIPPQPYMPPSQPYYPANQSGAIRASNKTECCQNITADSGQMLDIYVNKSTDLSALDNIRINMSAAQRNASVTGYSVKLQLVRAPLVSLASICNAPMVVEPQGIIKEVDCSQQDISDVAMAVHVRAGSGSFHFEIINKTEATDGNKFIIDETNGFLYPFVPFSEKAPADSRTLLGIGHAYDVLVQVTDTICDLSDHAYVSVMFVCQRDITTLRTRRPRSYRSKQN
ncbi:uncharacterized protein LOC129584097 [Paramacrobiotus metropolitanus]|uniref:uncharacterized protein LOC129584097 n=1 Tax=Paramacrobiotus metropolitanus TaxID=2943436 RepID=UPI002445C2A0|nr:uncharacterized protein LOC129584097 [Paramacrobiotus metropolitanus]